MQVKDLIEELQKHNPEAEVHVSNDRGYYEYTMNVSCSNAEATFNEDTDEWTDPPECDGSCQSGGPVVLEVD